MLLHLHTYVIYHSDTLEDAPFPDLAVAQNHDRTTPRRLFDRHHSWKAFRLAISNVLSFPRSGGTHRWEVSVTKRWAAHWCPLLVPEIAVGEATHAFKQAKAVFLHWCRCRG